MSILDNLPFASISYVAGVVLAIIGYLSNDLTVFQAFAAVGITGGAGFGIGYVRNQSGRGIAPTPRK